MTLFQSAQSRGGRLKESNTVGGDYQVSVRSIPRRQAKAIRLTRLVDGEGFSPLNPAEAG